MQVPPIPHLVTLPNKVIRILALTGNSLIEKVDYGVFFLSQLREKLAKENRKS